MEKSVSRRNFFKLLGGAVALATAPAIFITKKLKTSLTDIIIKTLRENKYSLADNIAKNNILYEKLKSRTEKNNA